MTSETALGWRRINLGHSAGQDFLGLAAPIENILDDETSGITNTTTRARYFSLVPWYYWRYTQLAGHGSAVDQRQFAIGFEMLLAYANIAWIEKTGVSTTGILRKIFCDARWKESRAQLPIRGEGVSDTPSPLDAVNYGPSLRRMQLLARHERLHSCRRKGEAIARQLDPAFRALPGYDDIVTASSLDRGTSSGPIVSVWTMRLHLKFSSFAGCSLALRNIRWRRSRRGSMHCCSCCASLCWRRRHLQRAMWSRRWSEAAVARACL